MKASELSIYSQDLSLEQIMKLKFSQPCTSSQEEFLVLIQFDECDQQIGVEANFAITDDMTIEELKSKWYSVNIGEKTENTQLNEITIMYNTTLFLQDCLTIKQAKQILQIEKFPPETIIRIYRQKCPHTVDECSFTYDEYEEKHMSLVVTIFNLRTKNGQSKGHFSVRSPLKAQISNLKDALEKQIKLKCKTKNIPPYSLKIKADSLSLEKKSFLLVQLKNQDEAAEYALQIDITTLDHLKIRQVIPSGEVVIIQFDGQAPKDLVQQYPLNFDPIVELTTYEHLNQNKIVQQRVIKRKYSEIRNIKVSTLMYEERVHQAMFTSVYFNNMVLKPYQYFKEFEQIIIEQKPKQMTLISIPQNLLYYFELRALESIQNQKIVSSMLQTVKTSNAKNDPRQHCRNIRQKLRQKNPNKKQFSDVDFLDPLIFYTSPYIYSPLNKSLRQSTVSLVSSQDLRKNLVKFWYYPFSEKLIKSLLKIRNQKGTFYRGSVFWNYNYKVGQIIQWNCFTSTSKQKSVATNFIIGQIKQKYPNGFPASTAQVTYLFQIQAYSGKNIDGYSFYENEKQVLILPYTKFKVTSIQIVTVHPQIKVTLVKLIEIPVPKKVPGNIVVWIDANVNESLTTFTQFVQLKGLHNYDLIQLVSNEHFEIWLSEFKHILSLPGVKVHFISNMNRPPLYQQEGIKTLEIVRSFDQKSKFIFYIGDVKKSYDILTNYCQKNGKQIKQLNTLVINNPNLLLQQFLQWNK